MRNFLKIAAVLILAYLVLIHFTGFSKDVSTVLGGTGTIIKDFQGR
jgi:predicted acyltransferase